MERLDRKKKYAVLFSSGILCALTAQTLWLFWPQKITYFSPEMMQAKKGKSNTTYPIFDFYTRLSHPEQSVATTITPKNTSSSQKITTKKVDKAPRTSLPFRKKNWYILQIASLKNKMAAYNLKKQLKIWGIPTNIIIFNKNDHSAMYRIRSTPFANIKEAHHIKKKLSYHGIDSLLMRQSKKG